MVDVTIPQIGESVTTVFIARWIRQKGDHVSAGDAIVELDSDKASMEVPAPSAGVLSELLAAEGDEVEVGSIVARIDETSSAEAPTASGEATTAPQSTTNVPEDTEAGSASRSDDAVRAGPAARQEAKRTGVDLGGVSGTGPRGRVTSDDVRRAETHGGPSSGGVPVAEAPAIDAARIERVKMTPLRRTIARRLVEAQQNAAMLTTFNEIDMSGAIAMRKQYQDRFKEKYGIKLGFMSFFVKAAIEGLKAYPAVNAEIDGDEIVYKHFYNIGVAVSGPKGLVVPVVRDADRLSFAQVEQAIAELATKARDNKLRVQDFQDGTFTISNGGVFGSLMSTPILNPPQSGILGMHAFQDRPVGIDGEIVLRPMMYVAMSYDHRIIDGREAVSFLVRVKELVEHPERILLEV